MNKRPLVTILTPVFNGGPYLREAVESVLSQSYDNWEYVIVNNLSTDDTLAIAETYAKQDSRIRVSTNATFVDCESNHNNAFRFVGPSSQYCKVVSADDWLLPGALARFVEFAVEHPSVGIVAAYQQSRDAIRWTGLPLETAVISGREVCRQSLLDDLNVFGNPTSVLYRSDLVRKANPFFPHTRPHADTSACYASLKECDFGFIHDVLTVERVHDRSVSSASGVDFMDAHALAFLEMLLEYGPSYLTEEEFGARRKQFEAIYYRTLARGLLRFRGRKYWAFHNDGMRELKTRLSKSRTGLAMLGLLVDEVRHPLFALGKFKRVLSSRLA